MSGKFITLEGIEGSGKSTQIKLLSRYLSERNIAHLCTREPGGTPIAEAIRALLLDIKNQEMLPETELLLYSAARAQHSGELIIPALSEGKIVISDRYYDSTYAYQGAARELDFGVIDTLTEFVCYGKRPDLTILLDLPAEIGLGRISSREQDRLEQEALSFHQKVREQFLIIAKKQQSRYLVIDAQKSEEAIHFEIIKALKALLGEDK